MKLLLLLMMMMMVGWSPSAWGQEAAPATGAVTVAAEAFSAPQIEALVQQVKQSDSPDSDRTLERLSRSESGQALQAVVNFIADGTETEGLRRRAAKALARADSDQAGLYLVDAHKAIRAAYSQGEALLALEKAYGAFAVEVLGKPGQSDGGASAFKEFGRQVAEIMSGTSSDLSILVLASLRKFPYAQVVEYLDSMVREGGSLERVAAVYAMASMRSGIGLPRLEKSLAEADTPEAARLAGYAALVKDYGDVPGVAGFVLRRLPLEAAPALQAFLVRGVGRKAGREGLEVLGKLKPGRGVEAVIEAATAEISARNPSEFKHILLIVGTLVVIGLALLAMTSLRMPASVIEWRYLGETDLVDVTVQLQECEMAQVVQGLVRIDPAAFAPFMRISLLYEGQGEIAFREPSFQLLNEPPANFVGGGTVVDGWHWNRGQPGRVLGNWYFDLRRFSGLAGKPGLMLGLLFRAPTDPPAPADMVVTLKLAGVKPGSPKQSAAYQDRMPLAAVARERA